MNNPLYTISKPFLNNGLANLNQNIKILLYKQDEKIFEVLDFENNAIYKEPLFFAYFNEKNNKKNGVESIVCGFSDKAILFQLFSDEFGRIYLPNVGWFLTNQKNVVFDFDKLNFKLLKENIEVDFLFEKKEFIENTTIELIKYSVPLLKQFYYNTVKPLK